MNSESRKISDYIPVLSEKRQQKFTEVISRRQPDLTVVMENIHDPHNVFAIMRTCDAVGILEIYIVNTIEPKRRKHGKKSSASANKWVKANVFTSIEECVKVLKAKNFKIFATHLSSEAKSLYEIDFKEPTALVFGNEKDGVSEGFLKYADGNFIIPMAGMIPSLNVSVATAISLYEAYRQRKDAGFYNESRLNFSEAEELYKNWASK